VNKHLLAFVFCLIAAASFAQPYGNEWIDYDQSRYYFKFKVASDGIYRINQPDLSLALQAKGVSISAIDPRSFQVFARGQEQFIHVEGQQDGTFDASDYIELYCEKNTGWLDERMYPSPDQQTHPNYSLYSDTTTYFITWNPSGTTSTKRYTTVANGTPAVTPLTYFYRTTYVNYPNYRAGAQIVNDKPQTRYHGGKGWTSGNFGYHVGGSGSGILATMQCPNVLGLGAPNYKIEMGLAGFNRGAVGSQAHHIRIRQGISSTSLQQLDEVILGEYQYVQKTTEPPSSILIGTQHVVQAYCSPTGSLVSAATDYNVVPT
jgi:hypothetical protein